MDKTVEKIVINAEGIDVVSNIDGVSNVTQLNLESAENEAQQIFDKHGLSNLITYPFDIKIVRALEINEEQLKSYIETCRRGSLSKGKIDIPESIPNIEYDLRELKNSFDKISDEELRKSKQLSIYKDAKNTQDTFKSSKGKVLVRMGILDKAYFAVQELLNSGKGNKTLALNPGRTEVRKNLREELRNSAFTEKTNQVSQEYAKQNINTQETEKEEMGENEK